jgi:hypothetical protein
MLHPDLWDMLELARGRMPHRVYHQRDRLQEEQNNRLIDAGVDLISVSFAGTAPAVHGSLRTHSGFSGLCANFENLAELKKRRGVSHPPAGAAFLMTRQPRRTPRLIELACLARADEVAATNTTLARPRRWTPSTSLPNSPCGMISRSSIAQTRRRRG